MNDILAKALEVKADVMARAMAHQVSAEDHRAKHVLLGCITTAVTGAASTGTVGGLASQLGLDGKGTISAPASALAWWVYGGLTLLLVLAPALTAMQAFFKHAEQSAEHKASAEDYERIRYRIETFVLRWQQQDAVRADRDKAIGEWDQITGELGKLSRIILTNEAFALALKK